jgi:hypothetical protein
MKMAKFYFATALAAATLLGGCTAGLTPYTQSSETVIATASDGGRDSGVLVEGDAAIAYDPDGCQTWIIDDGVEGYSGRRFDPVSGLPVCNDQFPPGTVVGNYQSQSPGLKDRVPALRLKRRVVQ